MKNERFVLFSNCFLIKGYNRSIILDLQREDTYVIPNTMHDVITLLKNDELDNILDLYDDENSKILLEYLDYLEKNELGFYIEKNELNLFTQLNTKFEIPNKISNSIIEISEFNNLIIENIIKQLDELNCKFTQIISYLELSKESLLSILKAFDNSNFRSIELILKYSEDYDNEFIQSLDQYNFRITSLIIHSSPFEKEYGFLELSQFYIRYVKKHLLSFIFCGNFSKDYFSANYYKVLESINHNSCLNKKISIDKEGNIKNCPSMPQSFGNIKDSTLEEALNHPDFKKYWNVNKDMIAVCKDCEFRHICTDCRAYTEQTHFEVDIDLSKPLKCGYNPYTNVWEEWSTNPLKQKAIEYYGMQDLVKKNN